MNGSVVRPRRLLEVTVALSCDAQRHALVETTHILQTRSANWGPLSVLRENGTPNLANIGAIASIILVLVVDFKIATSRNLL